MHWQSPNFYAYFPSAFSFPSLLGDLMSSALSVNGFLWVSSPAATELETVSTILTFGLTCLRYHAKGASNAVPCNRWALRLRAQWQK